MDSEVFHKCEDCSKEFREVAHLNEHRRFHIINPHKCHQCNESFGCLSMLDSHERTHTGGEKPFECSKCLKCFSQKSHFNTHMITHTGERPYKRHCGKSFTQSGAAPYKHKRTHTGQHRCIRCGKYFANSAHLNLHKRVAHSEEKPHKCNQRDKSFEDPTNLTTMHKQLVRSGERPFKCLPCNKYFARQRYLASHERLHNGEEESYEFNNKPSTEKEKITTQVLINKQNKIYNCAECETSFYRRKSLIEHIQNHTVERSYHNSHSEKPSAQRKSQRRSSTRIERRPYNCKKCNKSFNRKSDLGFHARIHSKNKLHACKLCTESFKNLRQLKSHEKIHATQKFYKCTHCEKKFPRYGELKNHRMRVHYKENFSECSKCDNSFDLADKFKLCQCQDAKGKSFICDICGERCALKSQLRYHIFHKHVINQKTDDEDSDDNADENPVELEESSRNIMENNTSFGAQDIFPFIKQEISSDSEMNKSKDFDTKMANLKLLPVVKVEKLNVKFFF